MVAEGSGVPGTGGRACHGPARQGEGIDVRDEGRAFGRQHVVRPA